MQQIQAIIFKEYFFKKFNKLDIDIKNIFYSKLEILETKDYISKPLHFKEHDIDLRSIRIGKLRFLFVLDDYKAIFLDVMYRELDYKPEYLKRLYKVYKYSN